MLNISCCDDNIELPMNIKHCTPCKMNIPAKFAFNWITSFRNRYKKMNCELMLTYVTPAYMFNVYKNQPSRQTGSRNVTGPNMLPTIWGTYMKLVTKYQISAINNCWEKCDEKYLGTDGRTDRGKTVYTPSGGAGV